MMYPAYQNSQSTGAAALHQAAPEGVWALAVISLLILFSFAAVALAIYRNTERGTLGRASRRVPPIPMAMGFDARLTPDDRLREVSWLESMMEAPARQIPGRRSTQESDTSEG